LNEFLQALTGLEQTFFGLATFGGSIFLISILLQFLGGGDADALDGGDATGDASGGEPAFKVFSIQSIGAFSLVSGATGLALSKDLGLPEPLSVSAAIGSGVVILWCMSLIFKTFLRFSANGALDYSQALLEEGEVYLTVPAEGTGLVQLTIQGRLVTASARALGAFSIPTGSKVVVREIDDNETLVVEVVTEETDNATSESAQGMLTSARQTSKGRASESGIVDTSENLLSRGEV